MSSFVRSAHRTARPGPTAHETPHQSFRGSPGVTDKELIGRRGGEQLFVRGVTNPHLHPWGSAEPES